MKYKHLEDVYWKLYNIAREIGCNDATLKRYIKRHRIKLLKYKGAYWLPRAQVVDLVCRMKRAKKRLPFAIYKKLSYNMSSESKNNTG